MKMIITICITGFIGLFLVGCNSTIDHDDIDDIDGVDGGVIDNTDYSATKIIQSKNITSFKTYFVASSRYVWDEGGTYGFEVKDNENGEHILTVSGVYDYEMVVEDSVFVGIQEIIDHYALVENNGAGKITAGLAPEYDPWLLDVDYESGEKLYFYETGSPNADWAMAFRDYFIDLMIEDGCQEVIPPKEAVTITDFYVSFLRGNEKNSYEVIDEGDDDNVVLYHYYENMNDSSEWNEEYEILDRSFYDELQDMIDTSRIDTLDAPISLVNPPIVNSNEFFEIILDYENGRGFDYTFEAYQLPKDWQTIKNTLVSFFDEYFQRETEAIYMLDGDYTYVDNEILMEMIEGNWVSEDGVYTLNIHKDYTIEVLTDNNVIYQSNLKYAFLQPGKYQDVDFNLDQSELKDKQENLIGVIDYFYTKMNFDEISDSKLIMEVYKETEMEEIIFVRK